MMFSLSNLAEQFPPDAPMLEAVQLILGNNLGLWINQSDTPLQQIIPKQCVPLMVRALDRCAGKLEKVQEMAEADAAALRARMIGVLQAANKRHCRAARTSQEETV